MIHPTIPNATLNAVAEIQQTGEAHIDMLSYIPTGPLSANSKLRRVFQTSDQMKTEFVKFLKTIFFQLDDKKVCALMENLLADPNKTDEEIYKELLNKIGTTKKDFSFLSKLHSLFVLKKGMGEQAAQLMKEFCPAKFQNYMEIYDRRYVNTLRKTAKLPLNGNIIAVCDAPEVGLADRIQAGSLFSFYPYNQHIPLNDADCADPLMEPEKTHRPISDEVQDNSVDLIGCLGGLHHIPAERVGPFVDSLNRKLKFGGVILFRDHNVANEAGTSLLAKEDLEAIASVVHTFVNAADGVSWESEQKEIREFKSLNEWTTLMENHGFKRISPQELVLPEDPTENAMIAFIKNPTNLEELKETISYRNDCARPKEGTRATWIEWGNVRFSKQYAHYVQNHHAYAFDFIGHMRQHWQHFYYFLKESLKDPDVRLKDLLFSDNMAMNLFILTAATFQCCISSAANLPSQLMARWNHGQNWRNICALTELEKFEAQYEKDYSSFIDHTPFYMYNYIGKIKELWKVIWNSPESFGIKMASALSGIATSIGFFAKAVICAPIKAFYTSEANQEPETIKLLIADPNDEINALIDRWELEKDPVYDRNNKIEIIHQTADGHKLVSMPRYKPFTKICGYLAEAANLEMLEIGCQKEVSIDVQINKTEQPPQIEGARLIYKLDNLQEAEKQYATYQVNVCALKHFQRAIQVQNIEYIHE